jgi:hypothetical protein
MKPKKIIDITKFIKGTSNPKLVVENKDHAGPLASVLFESKTLYDMLHGDFSLDDITEQISKKNIAALAYQKATGVKWPF